MSYTPLRGDFAAHYGTDLIPIIEATNCGQGCTNAGTPADIDEFGPGGNCYVLALVGAGAGEPIAELAIDGDTIRCSARIDPEPTIPLFDLPEGNTQ